MMAPDGFPPICSSSASDQFDDESAAFDWNVADAPVVIQHLPRTAIYINELHQAVVRQKRDWYQDEDAVVIFNAESIGEVIAQLVILKRQLFDASAAT